MVVAPKKQPSLKKDPQKRPVTIAMFSGSSTNTVTQHFQSKNNSAFVPIRRGKSLEKKNEMKQSISHIFGNNQFSPHSQPFQKDTNYASANIDQCSIDNYFYAESQQIEDDCRNRSTEKNDNKFFLIPPLKGREYYFIDPTDEKEKSDELFNSSTSLYEEFGNPPNHSEGTKRELDCAFPSLAETPTSYPIRISSKRHFLKPRIQRGV